MTVRKEEEFGTVKGLGSGQTEYKTVYSPDVLEFFDNRFPDNEYMVSLNCPEWTGTCPITKQPDFATIYINYVPDKKLVESKSLKLYMFGFRNHGCFHEDVVNTILNDLESLLDPNYIEVLGLFLPRGGISIDPFSNYGKPETKWEMFAQERLLNRNAQVLEVNNR